MRDFFKTDDNDEDEIDYEEEIETLFPNADKEEIDENLLDMCLKD